MNGDFNLDVGSALPYLVEQIKELFGQDEYSKSVRELVDSRAKQSVVASRRILIAGMSEALSLEDAYQVLRVGTHETDLASHTSVDTVINSDGSAILFAPPGRGKSVSLQHACMVLARQAKTLPLLYLLREPRALDELRTLADALKTKVGKKHVAKSTLVLLLDGYDEIDYSERRWLSEMLRNLEPLEHVRFLLTCRKFYEIIDLRVDRFYLQPFTEDDALRFLSAFLARQRVSVQAGDLLEEMKRRGFSDFFGNPLFLALSALLQRGERPHVPRNAVRLLDEVVEYLAFNWDPEKGVTRELGTNLPDLDGRDLFRCLKRIAAAFEEPTGSQYLAEREVRDHLKLMQNAKVVPQALLMELARWFGLFVPTDNLQWSFVHRSVHEYLAARFMVESGEFTPREAKRNWRRAQFAACFMSDATKYVCQALEHCSELEMFVECCANDAPFNPIGVVHALIRFYDTPRDGCQFELDQSAQHVSVTLDQDYLYVVKSPVLQEWVDLAAMNGDGVHQRGALIGMALALSELRHRDERAREISGTQFQGYRWTVTRSGVVSVAFTSKEICVVARGQQPGPSAAT